MDDTVRIDDSLDPDGFHHAAAVGCAIPGIDIDMLAPEAFRAVVGVARPLHGMPAMLAGEVLDGTYEDHIRTSILASLTTGIPLEMEQVSR